MEGSWCKSTFTSSSRPIELDASSGIYRDYHTTIVSCPSLITKRNQDVVRIQELQPCHAMQRYRGRDPVRGDQYSVIDSACAPYTLLLQPFHQ
ncbi:unnamed protein product [Danaus chrysippus]|uniref:(African queen) hypothetical protein n=1 Tax=Danaus chrysippus TaxID=151541 RepID=A0A8J2R8W8_9NEOP|nr:unnamed protein product [Danaus chrysippus]